MRRTSIEFNTYEEYVPTNQAEKISKQMTQINK